jgi:hypothetical protein
MDVAVQFQDRSCPVGMTRAAQVTWTRGHSTGQRGRHMARCKTRSPRQAHRRSSRRHTGLRSRSQKHQGNKTLPCTCHRRRLSCSPPRASSDLADRAPAPRSKPNQIKSNQFESTQIKSRERAHVNPAPLWTCCCPKGNKSRGRTVRCTRGLRSLDLAVCRSGPGRRVSH